MKQTYSILIGIVFWSSITTAQTTINFPCGTTPTIDGVLNPNEWNDADTIEINGLNTIQVYFKHDDNNLYFAFDGPLESSNVRFPEIMFDLNNDKTNIWQMDDWWFHVSATDCEYQGQPANYDSCSLVRPNWTAVSNILPGGGITDFIEIQIPLSTLGLDLANIDTIGIAFNVTNTFNVWEYWPAGADINQPSTWANATVLCQPLDYPKIKEINNILIFPNPTTGQFSVKIDNQLLGSIISLDIVNMAGQVILSRSFSDSKDEIGNDLNFNLNSGVYCIRFNTSNQTIQKRVIVN